MKSDEIQSALMRNAKKNLSDWIQEYITQQIIDGRLRPGDQLPTEVEYSEQFGVSRHAVREAVKALTALGIVEIRRAEGTYIVDKYNKKLLNPLVYSLILNGQNVEELLELNVCLLRDFLILGKERMTEGDLERLQEVYDALSVMLLGGSRDIDGMTEKSAAFYRGMAAMAKNKTMEQIYDSILDILTQTRRQGFVHAVEDDAREAWMENYTMIMRYYRGEDVDLEEVLKKLSVSWGTHLS